MSSDPNNTAFLLLHQELYTEAQKVLHNKLSQRGPGIYELSNLAVCEAMMGNTANADKYLNAAKYYAQYIGNPSSSEEAFILFCEALMVVLSNSSLALNLLKEACEKSEKIKEYIDYSLLISNLRSGSASVDSVFQQI